jgi:hypothetical protein
VAKEKHGINYEEIKRRVNRLAGKKRIEHEPRSMQIL